jgi:hypothetical protein
MKAGDLVVIRYSCFGPVSDRSDRYFKRGELGVIVHPCPRSSHCDVFFPSGGIESVVKSHVDLVLSDENCQDSLADRR